MAGRLLKTLFLDKKDYKTFINFMHLINDLSRMFDEVELDELQDAIDCFIERVAVKKEEED